MGKNSEEEFKDLVIQQDLEMLYYTGTKDKNTRSHSLKVAKMVVLMLNGFITEKKS